MNDTEKLSTWQRSTTRRFLAWFFSARTWRRGLITLAWAAALIALCYGIADWRGRRAWNEYRQNFEAKVASLDLRSYIPKEIPDSENFAATPFAQSWIKNYQDTNQLYSVDAYSKADAMIYSPKHALPERHFEDLAAWREAFAAVQAHQKKPKDGFHTDRLDLASRALAAPAVLDSMKDDDTAIEELRAASVKPDARYPVVYDMDNPWAILLPHLAKVKQTCQRLRLRADAELAAGQCDNALADVKLSLYLADTLKPESFVISYLVRIACVHIALQSVWEGLAEHRWTEAQLQQLQARLESYNFPADAQLSMHSERAGGVMIVDFAKKKGINFVVDLADMADAMVDASNKRPEAQKLALALLSWIMPSGWYDQEKLNYCLHYDTALGHAMDGTAKRVSPSQMALGEASVDKLRAGGPWHVAIHHDVVAALMLPSMMKIPGKVAAVQATTDQAAIACALERYRLVNGQFPGDPQALVPHFMAQLPNDVITGDSFKYRLTADGRPILYSIGWNNKDDGGVPGKTMFDQNEGDWVWNYPAL